MKEPRFICPCAREDYERHPNARGRVLVPTSANCPEHNQFHPDYPPSLAARSPSRTGKETG